MEFSCGTKYEREFKDDKNNGHGKIVYSNESKYEGDFKNNLKVGKRVFMWPEVHSNI